MSDLTSDNFWAILHSAPEPKPVFFRLYHDDHGNPIMYTMEDLPGNYIEVTPDVYAVASFNVQVVSGKLVHMKPKITVKKLQPSTTGTPCDPSDVCIVVDTDQPHVKWTIVNNEIN